MKERPSSRSRQPRGPRPSPRRKSPPPRSAPKSQPPKRRWKRITAYVARKVDEHAHLAQDAMRIALTLAILVLVLMLGHSFYRVWQETLPAARPSAEPARR